MLRAPAKVNFSLSVVGRQPDGYHQLDSLVIFVDLYDQIMLQPAETSRVTYTGPFGAALAQQMADSALSSPDILLRTLAMLRQHDPAMGHYHITLHKHIPIGAGLGGGSADAAAVLRHLAGHWPETLQHKIALTLGADVPVCLYGQPARMRGLGQQITPLHLPESATEPLALLLVFPYRTLSTEQVFAAYQPTRHACRPATSLSNPTRWHNDLQATAISLCPDIATVMTALRAQAGCDFVGMSGSGSTVFAVFAHSKTRDRVAERIIDQGWFVHRGYSLTRLEDATMPQETRVGQLVS